jgi:hypothetical protein
MAHNRTEKGGTENSQKISVEMGQRKLNGQPDLPWGEKSSMNDGKHEGKTKAKMKAEKPERSVRK